MSQPGTGTDRTDVGGASFGASSPAGAAEARTEELSLASYSALAGSGRLERTGHWKRLVFERLFAVRADRLWRALTAPEQMEAWFPQRVEYLSWNGDPAPGAGLRFTMPDDSGDVFGGEVFVCDAPTAFALRWGTDVLRFDLVPAEQGTMLRLVVVLDGLGKAARDAAGWHTCLDSLQRYLLEESGEAERLDVGPSWAMLFEAYARAYPPEASTVKPPVGRGTND